MILQSFGDAFAPSSLIAIITGVAFGYVAGVVPGLSRPAALAIAVPLTYAMTPVSAIAFLVGIAKASAAGGATGAIMLNTPGEPSSAATCFEGYPLAQSGQATKALKVALYASVFGDICATIVLIAIARPLASFALQMGPIEMTAVMLFALTFIAGLSGSDLMRGLVSGTLGILLATVGLDPETATPRLTFGMVELFDGVPLLAVTVGMLAFTEMLVQAERALAHRGDGVDPRKVPPQHNDTLTVQELKRIAPTTVRSAGVGIASGIIPGLGPTIGAFLAYTIARWLGGPGDKWGRGEIKGVAATEAADNAVLPASFIPLFAIGLPGSVSAAILVAAFMLHGVAPGPLIFEQQPRLIYSIYISMLIASIAMLFIGRIGLHIFARIRDIPLTTIVPFVVLFCIVGAFMETQNIFSIYVMIAMGILGYIMQRYGYSVVTFLIGFVVGPLFEISLRQSMVITKTRGIFPLDHPIALVFVLLTVGAAVVFARSGGVTRR